MSTYNDYSIVNVYPDFTNKALIIETNFKVDPTSVDLNSVKFYDYDNSKLYVYGLKCDGKKIIIQLATYPVCGLRYYLHIVGIKDALGRTLKTQYNDYIIFSHDVKTKVTIMSPASRVTHNSRVIDIKLKATEIEPGVKYTIEVSPDSSFFKVLSSIRCNESVIDNKFSVEGEDVYIDEAGTFEDDVVKVSARIEREGQLFMRARAELSDSIVGDWSEMICFNIQTISMDSLETTFLEDYLTSYDLFDEETIIETEITDKSEVGMNEGMFYLEFNKKIKLPANYELDENGYIKLGVVTGTRKELYNNGPKKQS